MASLMPPVKLSYHIAIPLLAKALEFLPGPRSLLGQEAAIGVYEHSRQLQAVLERACAPASVVRPSPEAALNTAAVGGRCANFLQPAVPLGPSPEAVPRPEPVHGLPGHV